MKLLLTSNGFIHSSIENDFLELTGGRADIKVAIIPTAGDPIEWIPLKEGDTSYDNFVPKLIGEGSDGKGEYYDYFIDKGYEVIVVDLKEDSNIVREKLQNVDVISVGGGDVNYLLEWAKKAKLETFLKAILDKSVVYVGASAGSMLLQPDIGLTWWEPTMKADHTGLNVINFIIAPHQKEIEISSNIEKLDGRRKYLQSVINFPWKIYLLQDGQAIKVIGDNIEHIGSGKKKFI